jgi:uncharacterized YccA/Bax inhibitor family protein
VSNPYFNNSELFGNPKPKAGQQPKPAPQWGAYTQQGYPTQAAAGTTTMPGYTHAPSSTINANSVNTGYGVPGADAASRRMTYDDVIVRTGGLLILLVAVAFATWQVAPFLWPVGMIVGLVFGLINSFKRQPSPVLIVLYTLAQGVFLGGISQAFAGGTFQGEAMNSIVFQAVLATIVTFGATLALFRSGKVRVTPKFTRWLIIALVGFMAFQLINMVLVWTGLLAGAGARGGGIGLLVGLVAVGLAAASLIVDFDSIKRGVERGAPQKFAWAASFGLMVTLIWLYIEFLRIFAILAGSRR